MSIVIQLNISPKDLPSPAGNWGISMSSKCLYLSFAPPNNNFFSHMFIGLLALALFLSNSQVFPEWCLTFRGFLPWLLFTTVPIKVNQYIQNKNIAVTEPTETAPKLLPKQLHSCQSKVLGKGLDWEVPGQLMEQHSETLHRF